MSITIKPETLINQLNWRNANGKKLSSRDGTSFESAR